MTEKYKRNTVQEFHELEDWWGNYLEELHMKQEAMKKETELKNVQKEVNGRHRQN